MTLAAALAKTAAEIERTNLMFLGIGFLIVWAGIALYLWSIARRQRSIDRQLAEVVARSASAHRDPPSSPEV